MSDKFDKSRKQLGAEKVDNFLSKFGMGPKYKPTLPKKYECPNCFRHNAIKKEIHQDTSINEIVLSCPDCHCDSELD